MSSASREGQRVQEYAYHNARTGKPGAFDRKSDIKGDVVDWPDVFVTEEPADDDSMRRYFSAEERKALELTADDVVSGSK